jgi:pimeloyl-ACP methyl ester carboxylesterase
MKKIVPVLIAALALGSAMLVTGCAQNPTRGSGPLVTEDFMIPTADPGIQLHVRNRRPADLARYTPDNIVLFVHGATTPPEAGFDLKLDGVSWMEWMASRGYDTWFVSVRGYGKSTRPREMNEPPMKNAPIVRTETAAKDVGTAVDFIRGRRGVSKINLLAHSWGTAITTVYTSTNNDKVNRLTLYAPVWIRTQGLSLTDSGGTLGAYRTVTAESVKKRRSTGLPPGVQQELMPERWLDTYLEAAFTSDPWSATQNPRAFRAPNGVVLDGREYWNAGKPMYDPADIRVPILLILAEWDADTPLYMAQTLFPKLVNAPLKRMVVIGEGTHVILTEKNRMQLFREVHTFFDEGAQR